MVGAQDKPSQCSSHRTESEIEVGNVVAVDLPQYSNIERIEEPFRLNMVIMCPLRIPPSTYKCHYKAGITV